MPDQTLAESLARQLGECKQRNDDLRGKLVSAENALKHSIAQVTQYRAALDGAHRACVRAEKRCVLLCGLGVVLLAVMIVAVLS